VTLVGGTETTQAWRDTVQAPTTAWWWTLDVIAAQQWTHPGWTILAGLCLTISLSFTTELVQRFLNGGPDSLGVFTILAQGLLTVLAGSALLDVGRKGIERVLSCRGVARQFYDPWKAVLAIIVLLFVLAIRLALPDIAVWYNNQGFAQQQLGKLVSAAAYYQRAISLNPDYAAAHYNLATAEEDLLDTEKAQSEYKAAILADARFYPAYINLGRLLLRKNQFADALDPLNSALTLPGNLPTPVQYSLLKNRAWAYLGLQYWNVAVADMHQALRLRADGAGAHCLLAQVEEAQGAKTQALTEWEACLADAPGDVVEPVWLGLARDRLEKGGSQ